MGNLLDMADAIKSKQDRGEPLRTLNDEVSTDIVGAAAKTTEARKARSKRSGSVFGKTVSIIGDLKGILTEEHPAVRSPRMAYDVGCELTQGP